MSLPVSPSVIASWSRAIPDALRAHGIDPDPVLHNAGFCRDSFVDPNTRHSAGALRDLWRHASQAANDPAFGLRVSKQLRPATFHALGYAVLASTTLREALERIGRYQAVVSNSIEISLREGDGLAELRVAVKHGYSPGVEIAMDAALSALVRVCGALRGERMPVHRVLLRRPLPDDATPWQRFYGCPVLFDMGVDGLVFNADLLEERLPAANPVLARHNDEAARAYLAAMESGTLVDRARAHLARDPGENTAPAELARALGVSLRTMQRLLREHGTSFEELRSDVRRELACAYLREGQHSISTIAQLLGYEHESTFARAFRRWTACSPSEFTRRV